MLYKIAKIVGALAAMLEAVVSGLMIWFLCRLTVSLGGSLGVEVLGLMLLSATAVALMFGALSVKSRTLLTLATVLQLPVLLLTVMQVLNPSLLGFIAVLPVMWIGFAVVAWPMYGRDAA